MKQKVVEVNVRYNGEYEFKLDNGYKWYDSKNRHELKVGDYVKAISFMGMAKIEKVQ